MVSMGWSAPTARARPRCCPFSGEHEATEGTVTLTPRTSVVAFCRQVVDRRDEDVDALAVRDDGLAAELRGRLALESE